MTPRSGRVLRVDIANVGRHVLPQAKVELVRAEKYSNSDQLEVPRGEPWFDHSIWKNCNHSSSVSRTRQ